MEVRSEPFVSSSKIYANSNYQTKQSNHLKILYVFSNAQYINKWKILAKWIDFEKKRKNPTWKPSFCPDLDQEITSLRNLELYKQIIRILYNYLHPQRPTTPSSLQSPPARQDPGRMKEYTIMKDLLYGFYRILKCIHFFVYIY